jgi:Protein of unknown function (DUF1565)
MKPMAPAAAEVLESRLLLTATLIVDPASSNPAVFHTIQGAVNAASAGDTIQVAPGLYNEDVTVSTPVTILGGQPQLPGEKGPSKLQFESTGFTVSASSVTIEGFQIGAANPLTSTDTGILATDSANSTFDNNVFLTAGITFNGGVTQTEVANNSSAAGKAFAIDVSSSDPSVSNAYDTFTNNILNLGTSFLMRPRRAPWSPAMS